MEISVCVATSGNLKLVTDLVDSLQKLEFQADWELILVWNSPSPPHEVDVKFLVGRVDFPVEILHEPIMGKSSALNLAMSQAQGELWVFTDDDVEVSKTWLQELSRAAAEYPDVNVFGGRVISSERVPNWIRNSSNLHAALICEHDLGAYNHVYSFGEYPYGTNLAIRAKIVKTGGYKWPLEFGPGTDLPVGDEAMFLAQFSPFNSQDRLYVESAVVRHDSQGRYFSIKEAIFRVFQIGYAAGVISQSQAAEDITRMHRRVSSVLLGVASIRELICICMRALGFYFGRRSANSQFQH